MKSFYTSKLLYIKIMTMCDFKYHVLPAFIPNIRITIVTIIKHIYEILKIINSYCLRFLRIPFLKL